ncbi:CD9 antigen-like isoform X2 [Antedon mediterranea]
MATGCVIMAVGFLGCCGAMQESICMLVFYFIALLTIFGLEIAGCTWCYVNREEIGVMFSDELSKIIKEKYKENDIAAQKGVDLLQEKLKCCGIDSYMDWFDSGQMIPDSCSCNTTEDKSGCSDRGFYLNGCGKEIEEDVLTNIFILAGIGVGISFIEILGMLFSVVLCCAIFKSYDPEDEEYRYMAAIRPFARRKPEQKQSTPHETSFGIGIFRD